MRKSELDRLADLAIQLKEQYTKLLMTHPGHETDKAVTKDMDLLGQTIKELEDLIVVMLIEWEHAPTPENTEK